MTHEMSFLQLLRVLFLGFLEGFLGLSLVAVGATARASAMANLT